MANAFEPKKSSIPLQPKAVPETSQVETVAQAGGLKLPTPKPRRKQCSLYLDTEMMEWVKRIAQQEGVTIGAVIEACVQAARDQMEG